MGAPPQHPFFLKAISSLKQYDRGWVFPYITVMYSTGPLFLSVLWKEYLKRDIPEESRIRVIMLEEYSNHDWSFFTYHKGGTWETKDVPILFWMVKHWQRVIWFVFIFCVWMGSCVWRRQRRRIQRRTGKALRDSNRFSDYKLKIDSEV
jgi:mannosyltransferase OCH1-like enzyme